MISQWKGALFAKKLFPRESFGALKGFLVLFFLVLCADSRAVLSSSRLEQIRHRGLISAGISYEMKGFSEPDRTGKWQGLDIDFLRAAALALFGDERHVRFIQVPPSSQFKALASGKIDVLATSLPRQFYEKLLPEVAFIPPLFFDTNGFLVPKSLGVRTPLQVNGFRVCVADVPELLEGMLTFFKSNNMAVSSLVKGTLYTASDSYLKGKCDAFFARRSQLLGFLEELKNSDVKDDFMDLSFPISSLSAAVMSRDHELAHLLYCVRNALILAEQLGITSENIDRLKDSQTAEYDFFMKSTLHWGSPLNLKPEWAHKMIRTIGNYRQIYRRSFSSFKTWHLIEGLNRLTEHGGHIEQSWPAFGSSS